MCERVPLPGGGYAIICGRRQPHGIICDICNAPVRVFERFRWRGQPIDLCGDCQVGREQGDPEWRALAELRLAENLQVPAGA